MSPDGSMKTPPPEERLLKLIRGKGHDPASSAPVAMTNDPTRATVMSRHRGGQGWFAHWPRWLGGILGVVFVVEVGVVLFQLFRPLPSVEHALVRLSDVATGDETDARPVPSQPPAQVTPLSTYASRALFAAPVRVSNETKAVRAPSGQVSAMAARLSLLGVVAGDPAQAIIEDSKTQKTYFVSEGQTVVEGALVTGILGHRVILDFLGEAIELIL